MKKSNKWILASAGAIFAAAVSCQLLAQQVTLTGVPVKEGVGAQLIVSTVNRWGSTFDTLVVMSQNPSDIIWPNNIPSEGTRTQSVTIPENSSANVVYGYQNQDLSVCNYLFINIGGTVTVTSSPIAPRGPVCGLTASKDMVVLTVSS